MSATDTIRAMLDERGVEHFDGTEGTYWGGSVLARNGLNSVYRFSARESVGGLNVHLLRVTPEQAIEATLGRGECRLIPTRDKPRSKKPTLTCSECGWWTDRINDEWRYCPSCGKRVMA